MTLLFVNILLNIMFQKKIKKISLFNLWQQNFLKFHSEVQNFRPPGFPEDHHMIFKSVLKEQALSFKAD